MSVYEQWYQKQKYTDVDTTVPEVVPPQLDQVTLSRNNYSQEELRTHELLESSFIYLRSRATERKDRNQDLSTG